jgi:hypothetical protein
MSLYVTACAKISCESETSVHIQHSHVEEGEDSGITGQKERNQDSESSMKSKWMKLILGMHTPLKYS